MRVVAIPNTHYPPDTTALAEAHLVLDKLQHLTVESLERLR
jgi:hypothetical protein